MSLRRRAALAEGIADLAGAGLIDVVVVVGVGQYTRGGHGVLSMWRGWCGWG